MGTRTSGNREGPSLASNSKLPKAPFRGGGRMAGQIMGQPNPSAPTSAQRPRRHPNQVRARASAIATTASEVEQAGRHDSRATAGHY
ncbi:hypothetical protein BHE74_00005221 [Ensete ventricosum]|nr:hypothetical protein BHE74_00005221 [Ensete ventricosum]